MPPFLSPFNKNTTPKKSPKNDHSINMDDLQQIHFEKQQSQLQSQEQQQRNTTTTTNIKHLTQNQQSAGPKSRVHFDENPPEVFLRSPTTTPLSTALNYQAITANTPNPTSFLNNNSLFSPLSKRPENMQTTSLPQKNHNINSSLSPHIILLPFQYILKLFSTIFHILFLFPHIILHIFFLALLCFIVKSGSIPIQDGFVSGFTIFFFVTSIFHIISTFVGIAAFNGTELLLQIYVLITAVMLIFQCVMMFIFIFLLPHIISTYKKSFDISNESQTTLINLFDVLIEFKTVLNILQILDFFGLAFLLLVLKVKINYLYHDYIRSIPITPKSIIESFKKRKDENYITSLLQQYTTSQSFSTVQDTLPINRISPSNQITQSIIASNDVDLELRSTNPLPLPTTAINDHNLDPIPHDSIISPTESITQNNNHHKAKKSKK